MIVVDASVAAKWILPEPRSEQAEALYTASLQAGEPVVAPTLLLYEVSNILRQRMIRFGLSLAAAEQLMAEFSTLAVTILAPRALHQRALALAAAHNLSATYDAHYVALAEQLGCDLWTDDE